MELEICSDEWMMAMIRMDLEKMPGRFRGKVMREYRLVSDRVRKRKGIYERFKLGLINVVEK